MKSMFQNGSDFCLLGFAGLDAPRPLFAARPDIPSWVPDFSTPPHHNVWSGQYSRFNITNFPLCYSVGSPWVTIPKDGKDFDDNAFVLASSSLENTYTALIINGVCIDTVAGVLRGDPQYNFSHLPKFILEAIKRVDSLTPYPNGESAHDVLWKTLIAANEDCLERDSKGAGFDRLCSLIQAEEGTFSIETAWETEGRYYQTMITEGTAGSRGLFWTKDGYIGLAANGVEVGDEVWLIVGARVPFLFRKILWKEADSTNGPRYLYRLVCEAYVHGIMNGELGEAAKKADSVLLI